MKDEDKTKEQLLKELAKFRQRIIEFEKSTKSLKEEIEERKRAEEALRESEELYKALVRTSPDAIAVGALDGAIIEVSQEMLKLLRVKRPEDILGKIGLELVAPEDKEKVKKTLEKVLKEGDIRNVELNWIRPDGTRYIGETNATLIRDAYGNAKAIMSITRDITERKRAEEALRESEEMYRTLVKTSPDPIAVGELTEGKIIEMSDKTPKLFGLESPDELMGRSGIEFMIPEDQERAKIILQKVLKGEDIRNMEFTFMRIDGTRFIGEINATLIRDANGKPKAIMSINRDITERKKMEEKLKQYSQKLEQMVKERTYELKESQKEVEMLHRQIQQSKRYPEILGNSPRILQVIDLVLQVARSNSTVLIYGETGSGKDLIAKAIHFNSPRKDAPFLILNCATLPEHLIESELFGYVKGAFTGATQNKSGLFEEASKGTIFLNEIADIPLRLQGKLLQVLENQQIRRLGQSKSITVDVRIIAATNKDLKEAVKKESFREDLFYRLNVLPIKVPPLRERKKDIPLLVRHFLDKYCPAMDKQITDISQEAMDVLCRYNYPGNVRELENIIQHSIIIAQGSTLLPQYLPEELRGSKPAISPRSKRLLAIEKKRIEAAIQQCGGDLNQAAEKLGIHRTTLWRKRKKLGI